MAISPNQLAGEILTKYDQNKDSLLQVWEETFLRVDLGGVTKSESRGLLFYHADSHGTRDGLVDQEELEEYLYTFDTDGDGELTTFKNIFDSWTRDSSEYARFDARYGERYDYRE